MSFRTSALKAGSGGLVMPAAFGLHSATVILMHGLGDSADGMVDLATHWRSQNPHIKFVMPTAPTRPVTLNMGHSMPAWYNINGLDEDRAKDPCEGLEESAAFVHSLIADEQAEGLARSRILLAGFSQGGALALFAGLQQQAPHEGVHVQGPPLGGLLLLSAYLPKSSAFRFHEDYRNVPVLHCHGEADPVVRLDWATKSREHVLSAGLRAYTLRTFPGVAHSISMPMLSAGADFIAATLPQDDDAFLVAPRAPSAMSVKELKEAIAMHGLGQQAKGLFEKQDFVHVLEGFYKEMGLKV